MKPTQAPPMSHPPLDQLLGWWLHETDEAATDAIDEHLMQCDACGAALDGVIALGDAVRNAFRTGTVPVTLAGRFVQRLSDAGLRVREYHLPHNGGVDCTVAPEDDLLVARLEAPLADVEQLDARIETSLDPGASERLLDLPFDADTGQVVILPSIDQVRARPAHVQTIALLAVCPDSERELGRYTFRHQPWRGD